MKEELKQLYSETKYDVVLVRPPHGRKPQFDFFPDEHLGLAYLKAYVNRFNYKVLVIDCHYLRISEKKLIDILLKLEMTVLGFTVFQPDMFMVTKITKKLRKSGFNAHITIGGQFPSFEYLRIMEEFPQIDSVIRSEGEESLVSLLQHLQNNKPIEKVRNLVYRKNNKININALAPLLDLDTLPIPVRENISEFPSLGIISSKGCYQDCSYCGVKNFYSEPEGHYLRFRSINDLVDEIEYLYTKYKKRMFVFWDDNFLLPGKKGLERMDDFCNEIKKRNLKIFFGFETRADTINLPIIKKLLEVGLKYIFLGIESGSQASLEVFNKNVTVKQNWNALSLLSKQKITTLCAFIMYEPYSTVEKIKQNITFLNKVFSKLKYIVYYPFSFTRLDILKGSPIHGRLLKEGRIIDRPLKDFMVEGDLYTIEDQRIEDLSKITMHLDIIISECRLTLWRYVSWFSSLGDLSTTKHFVRISKKFEILLWDLNNEAIKYSLKYLENGLNFVQTENYKSKLDSYISKEEMKLNRFLEKSISKLDKIVKLY